ncbi:MAG: hypothetical protein AB1477_09065 [Acidobacteriota bacterium]
MNIEELELSLRSEYEGQLKQALAEVRREAADFEKRFEAEFEKQKAEMLRTLRDFVSRIPETYQLDRAFEESISEHLRLARDEGAQIAATAFGEAEKLKAEADVPVRYDLLRDSISDISSKDTQAGILSALVEHSEHFAPRGAFFIVKNDRFIGWKTFGAPGSEEAIREIDFPVNSDSMLAMAVRSLATARASAGQYNDDENFLSRLGFGNPAAMVAIPLIARGRGVAVLYVDSGDSSIQPNVDALESLVRVAGLTVELLAAMQTAISVPSGNAFSSVADSHSQPQPEQTPQPMAESPAMAGKSPEISTQAQPDVTDAVVYYETAEHSPETESVRHEGNVYDASVSYDVPLERHETQPTVPTGETGTEASLSDYAEYTGSVTFDEGSNIEDQTGQTSAPEISSDIYEIEYNEPDTQSYPTRSETGGTREFDFGSHEVTSEQKPADSDFSEPVAPPPGFDEAPAANGSSKPAISEPQPAVETAEPVVANRRPTRLGDRNIDLPIEVADSERRFHNDARRFARLLVSEIKYYNDQKVIEGRQNCDLYDRLREAIDRSREMYNQRVEPVVASRFDYFHYELVNKLAEGDISKLGPSYPGPTV